MYVLNQRVSLNAYKAALDREYNPYRHTGREQHAGKVNGINAASTEVYVAKALQSLPSFMRKACANETDSGIKAKCPQYSFNFLFNVPFDVNIDKLPYPVVEYERNGSTHILKGTHEKELDFYLPTIEIEGKQMAIEVHLFETQFTTAESLAIHGIRKYGGSFIAGNKVATYLLNKEGIIPAAEYFAMTKLVNYAAARAQLNRTFLLFIGDIEVKVESDCCEPILSYSRHYSKELNRYIAKPEKMVIGDAFCSEYIMLRKNEISESSVKKSIERSIGEKLARSSISKVGIAYAANHMPEPLKKMNLRDPNVIQQHSSNSAECVPWHDLTVAASMQLRKIMPARPKLPGKVMKSQYKPNKTGSF